MWNVFKIFSVFRKKEQKVEPDVRPMKAGEEKEKGCDYRLDCTGMICPRPIFEILQIMKQMKVGEVLRVECKDPAFGSDIRVWCERTGHLLFHFSEKGNMKVAYIKKLH